MKDIMSKKDLEKLDLIKNPLVRKRIDDAIELLRPAKVTVLTDSREDQDYIRNLALENGEEHALKLEGHTYHFDSPLDQARDKANTKYLLDEETDWGLDINWTYRNEGLEEINGIMDGIMEGKEMFVGFYCLGPSNSPFSIPALQITDSAYVVHSENILYRQGYEDFKNLAEDADFFYLVHSAGELENGVTKNIDKRRIYIDINHNTVYTCNNQYAGNSVGMKKLCFRLAIKKAMDEDWLAEHMFLMGVNGKNGRRTYMSGAFPSGCGKTSTAMVPGQNIVGDDISYIRNIDGEARAVNVEQGIFGIINDVNQKDDPLIFESLRTPREIIFSNTLISDGMSWWNGMKIPYPTEGFNHLGDWKKSDGQKAASKNARYTMRIEELENADGNLHNPEGVKLDAMIFGGRDAFTSVPITEASTWEHGMVIGATVESETTMAAIGKEGVRTHDPMATCDFISVPFTKFIEKHLEFGKNLKDVPKVYQTNYFLKNDRGDFTNTKLDKKVWLLWAEGRIHGDYDAIATPVGNIPEYEDLRILFSENLNYYYTRKEYDEQFSIRVDRYLEKMDRMKDAFKDTVLPEEFTKEFDRLCKALEDAREKFGKAVVAPEEFK